MSKRTAHDVVEQNKVLSGNCAMMKITHLAHIADVEREQVRDEIRILIPGNQQAFHVVYKMADGCTRQAFVCEPHVLVIPANQPHAIHGQRLSDMIAIDLDRTFFGKLVRDAFAAEVLLLGECRAGLDPFLREIGNTVRNEWCMRKPPGGAYWEALAGVIAIHLATYYGNDSHASLAYAGLPSHKLDRVKTYVREHLEEVIWIEHLADAVHLSSYHFARMFKKATGRSPHVYITDKRIGRAKELLLDSSLSLVDVAAKVGFQTQSHFTDVFRKYTGITPRSFRLSKR